MATRLRFAGVGALGQAAVGGAGTGGGRPRRPPPVAVAAEPVRLGEVPTIFRPPRWRAGAVPAAEGLWLVTARPAACPAVAGSARPRARRVRQVVPGWAATLVKP